MIDDKVLYEGLIYTIYNYEQQLIVVPKNLDTVKSLKVQTNSSQNN